MHCQSLGFANLPEKDGWPWYRSNHGVGCIEKFSFGGFSGNVVVDEADDRFHSNSTHVLELRGWQKHLIDRGRSADQQSVYDAVRQNNQFLAEVEGVCAIF